MSARDRTGHGRVGVLLGGLSAEREVSLNSGGRMAEALRERGHEVVEIDPGRDAAAQIRDAAVDVVLIGLHGTYGEDGCMQGLLEVMGVPYTGSPPLASALAFDKVRSKRLVAQAGVPTPQFIVIDADPPDPPAGGGSRLRAPVVVKPAAEGSSVGVAIVLDDAGIDGAVAAAAACGDGRVLVERFVEGVEVTVGVLDGRALGTVEIRPLQGFYDYEAKYLRDDTQYVVPANLPGDGVQRVSAWAEQVHSLLGCAGATRVDFMVDGAGDPWFIELNTLPGMTDHSLLPMAAREAGMDFGDLVEAILDRATLHHRTVGEAK